MKSAFILRFQEPCAPADQIMFSEGTAAVTDAESENVEAGSESSGHRANTIPMHLGTRTKVGKPGPSDEDRVGSNLFGGKAKERHAFEMITKTMTNVKAETSDNDFGVKPVQMIPMRNNLGTQTMTRQQAESPDSDPSGRQLQAIPKCSSS
jgi:hypothetical protein